MTARLLSLGPCFQDRVIRMEGQDQSGGEEKKGMMRVRHETPSLENSLGFESRLGSHWLGTVTRSRLLHTDESPGFNPVLAEALKRGHLVV
jgi:hypothetical protein